MTHGVGTYHGRLDALRTLLRRAPRTWHYVKKVAARSNAQSLRVNLCARGDDRFVVRQVKDGTCYRLYASWGRPLDK